MYTKLMSAFYSWITKCCQCSQFVAYPLSQIQIQYFSKGFRLPQSLPWEWSEWQENKKIVIFCCVYNTSSEEHTVVAHCNG